MDEGYYIGEAGQSLHSGSSPILTVSYPESLPAESSGSPSKQARNNSEIRGPPPSPLRPSLRLSRSSSTSFNSTVPTRANRASRASFAASSSSLSVPSLSSAASSSSVDGERSYDNVSSTNEQVSGFDSASTSDSDTELDEDTYASTSDGIPVPRAGVGFHARRGTFIILPTPTSAAPRVVSVQFRGSKVLDITGRKPFGAHPASFSQDDITLSARGDNHIALLRRSAKSGKVSVTLHRRENDTTSHFPTSHGNQLGQDFSNKSNVSAAVLALHGEDLYLVGNHKLDHVWRLSLNDASSGLIWQQDHQKTFPRPNTKPKHASGCPRTVFAWKNSLIVIGVEVLTNKRLGINTPYTSPKPKGSSKSKTKRENTTLKSSPASLSATAQVHALNIWQYSMLNHTWSRRSAASSPPQGAPLLGNPWPLTLSACIVGASEDVACVTLGRGHGSCVWALNLHSWTWTEIPSILPLGARIHATSSVGTRVYFMGEGLTIDSPASETALSSPIVHCDMSAYSPWDPSSRHPSTKQGLQTLIFPEASEPCTPTDDKTVPDLPPPHPIKRSDDIIAANLLPSYGVSPTPINTTVAALLAFTPYRALHQAQDDITFGKIKDGLIAEWMTCAMTLMGFIAIDAAVLGLSRDGTIMPIDLISTKAVAISMLSALVGIMFTCGLYIIYSSQDAEVFRFHSRDALNTYAFFAIRARVPMLAVGTTLISFSVFVYHCLMQLAPDIVLPIFVFAGFLTSLNLFVIGFFALRWVGVRVARGFTWVIGCGCCRREKHKVPAKEEKTDSN